MSEQKLVLVVDDQVGIRTLLAEALQMFEYQVETAAGGAIALQQIGQRLPDLVLLDMNMPGIPGLEVLQSLRKLHPKLPVLMITADQDELNISRATDLGISGWITKPLDLLHLEQQVQAALAE